MTAVIQKPIELIGAPLSRVEGERKVQGQATYSAEWPVENVTHGVLFGAAIASGRITAIDTSAAQVVRGVIGILTHENAPRLQALTAPPAGELLLPL
ncbi:MAG: xanthine dehydrogenase family protein molybdopterin-binding subunit, partial [Candidatus Baltobacteraceae bacterium]